MKPEPEHVRLAREAELTRKAAAEASTSGKPATRQPADEYPPEMLGDAYEGPPITPFDDSARWIDDAPAAMHDDAWEGHPPSARPTERVRPSGIIARPASAFEAAPIEWLWLGRIPCGALTIFDGDPGLGKSTITLDLAARVSRGFAMPPDAAISHTAPATAIILSAEDDPARTIRPRLEAAGADLNRVQVVEAVSTGGDGERLPILPYDLVALEQFVAEQRARLVIVDPLMAFLGDGIDSHKDQQIRLALRQFAKLAERTQCAFVIVRHLNKLTGGNALYRGGGSIGIIGAARSGLLLARHPDDPASRVLASTKSNLGPLPRSLVVSLQGAGPVAVAAWGAECDLSADEVLAGNNEARRSKVDQCADAIAELLAGGRMKSADLDAALERRGYRERTIKSARKAAGVKACKSSFDGEWWTEAVQECKSADIQ